MERLACKPNASKQGIVFFLDEKHYNITSKIVIHSRVYDEDDDDEV